MIKRKNIIKIAIDSPAAAGAGTLEKHYQKTITFYILILVKFIDLLLT